MRISSAAVLVAVVTTSAHAFQLAPVTTPRTLSASSSSRSSYASLILNSQHDFNEFDHLLGERTAEEQIQFEQSGQSPVQSRRRILLPGEQATVLASSTTFAAPGVEEETEAAVEGETAATTSDDPYADFLEESPQLMKYQQENPTFSQSVENKLKNMDLQDIVSTLIIPSIIAFAGARWGFNKISARVAERTDDTLDSFADEMIYHDSDFEEMGMCFNDYSKKLVWLGPRKTPLMLKRYLRLYAKKKTVSPQSISSLSYVFSLFKLKEKEAADILVSLCKDMGDEKISSAGKLLFFGSCIFKTQEGKAALIPIKDMIKATYREASVADEMVDMSQQAMGEAAYRAAVIAGGPNQDSLTIGWQVLGLDKETATRIFEDEKGEGFVSDVEKMYSGQSTRYDAKGNAINKEGKLIDPENAIEGSDEEKIPASGAMECSDCGYTLFIAKGREAKFFGDGFKCPNCGAKKDKFKPKEIDES
eukprot:CAMPEP_0113454000 /NCGR_PEP_ID=MMETSP0014_2-20120614/7642_1 /TAXON_ID=2857 /ORGANISM="Nitzschia sp." /LENGTH=476 /DNA_ID=CAMNT_0000345401 /DNA_START=146 /DNA_END=1576 /DNA_ORIENTATION=- /assembly_acc=CAM_ASM_000159